jgi:hypothetical protein
MSKKKGREDDGDMSSSKELSDQPTTKNLEPSIYEAAAQSLRDNKHMNNMVFYDEYLRDRIRRIQHTYKVKQDYWPNQGFGFQIRLIWDHDRLWGTFQLGFFNGVFLIGPGPGQDHF